MLPEPTKLSAESTEKIEVLVKKAQKELGKVLLISFLLTVGSVIPITILTVMLGMVDTAFPFVAGIMTGIMVHLRYVKPKTREINERYVPKILKIIKNERENA
jgi:hypothetical protein